MFYETISEVLVAGDFDSPMSLSETGIETHVYISAESPTEAATRAVRLLSEVSERVWDRVLPCAWSAS